jgi:hypothetical protein
MEWIQSNWQTIIGTLVALGGMAYIPVIRTILFKGLKALLSEAFLKEIFMSLAEKYVKSTSTKLDDVWFAQLKKSL